jgi:glyoxylate/hydroxypyruvate reductase A
MKRNDTPIPFIAAERNREVPAWVAALQRAMPDERIVAFKDLSLDDKENATVAIVANPDPLRLKELPSLRWVHSVWAGVERLVTDLAGSEIGIVRLVDPKLAATMAEAVLAWTLYLHREMPTYLAQQRQGLWRPLAYVAPQSRSVGILGLGELGRASAARLVDAGFKVCGWSRQPKSLAGVGCLSGADGLATMLAQTDILVCLLPLTAATRGLLAAETLGRLPQGASLINFARGAIVDDAALRAALDSGALAHAVLDVFTVEPLPREAWQWQHPRVTLLPHCSAATDIASAAHIVACNVRRYRETGEIPANVELARGY